MPASGARTLTFCTIISKNYLASARVLAESIAAHHPGAALHVLVVDGIDGRFDPAKERFEVTRLDELGIPDLPRFCFQYTALELCCAAKPYLMAHLLEAHRAARLVYLDADVWVTAPLDPLLDLLDRSSILLTPHLSEPYDDARRPGELDILLAGTFNLGFIAVAAGDEVSRLLSWWQRRLYAGCSMDPSRALHVDQRWIDLVPGLFPGAAIVRDPGYNVAYWNLHGRRVTRRDGRYLVDGVPCRFFHFSGYDPHRPERISAHQDRLSFADLGDAREAFAEYGRRLLANGHAEARQWLYGLGCFDDGEPIPPALRRLYLAEGEAAARFGDPFRAATPGGVFATWRATGRLDGVAPAPPPEAPEELKPGVNLVGHLRAETGVGEAGRATARALAAGGVPHALVDWPDPASENREGATLALSREAPYAVNLLQVNADEVPRLVAERGAGLLAGRHTVGIWNWELGTFPPACLQSAEPLDEVWAPSSFCVRALSRVLPRPVRRVPYAIDVGPVAPPGPSIRPRWGIPDDAFVFLFVFDLRSYIARKNPQAAVQAFRRAFGERPDRLLLLKTGRAEQEPEGAAALAAATRGLPNVRVVSEVLDRQELLELLRMCDAYVSLHRSEGLGLTMLEAMALGKPVIATAYSANVEFMNEGNSLPVRYRLAPIERDIGPYARGAVWAEPSVEHAAEQMRRVVDRPELARELGERAREDVARELSPARVGQLIRGRLAQVTAGGPPRSSRPGAATIALDGLEERRDLWAAPVELRRPIVGGVVRAAREAARRLLAPELVQQTDHNTRIGRALAHVDARHVAHVNASHEPRPDDPASAARVARVARRLWGTDEDARRRLALYLGPGEPAPPLESVHGDAPDQAFSELSALADGALPLFVAPRSLARDGEVEALRLLRLARRKLRPGGVVLCEGLNPAYLAQFNRAFSLEPDDLPCLPPDVLQVLVESAGFVGARVIQPELELLEAPGRPPLLDPLEVELGLLEDLQAGRQVYAVRAERPDGWALHAARR